MSKLPDVSRPLIIKRVPISQVVPWDKNPRGIKTKDFERLKKQIIKLGIYKPLICYEDKGHFVVLGGNMRIRALKDLGLTEVEISIVKPKTEAEKIEFALSDNDRAGFYEEDKLAELVLPHLKDINVSDFKIDIGEPLDLRSLLERFAPNLDGSEDQVAASLAERFIIPPLSVFDTRQGYWQDRKKAWTSLGIESYESREGTKATGALSGTVPGYYSMKKKAEKRLGRELTREEFAKKYLPDLLPKDSMLHCTEGGGILSVFDPVLCEIVYRWFCPRGGSVLDPFSGGSVRGIVASSLGLRYTGVDIRKAQVEANRHQAEKILLPETQGHDFAGDSSRLITDPEELTPVDKIGDIWAKREDLFAFAGARGGKVRACLKIASTAKRGLITAGSRSSPQVNIVAHVGQALGLPTRAHIPTGALSAELLLASESGCQIVQHEAGYNSVIKARAREDSEGSGWTHIPFGMECSEAIDATSTQVANLPAEVKRLVVPVGSGISLSGILWGLKRTGRSLPVFGVTVGADPTKILDKYAPSEWKDMVTLVKAPFPYHRCLDAHLGSIRLDPIYEAKTASFLKAGDCLWIVGIRESVGAPEDNPAPRWIVGNSLQIDKKAPGEYDFVFSCPPYFDLERYSDDVEDLSSLNWEEFCRQYGEIVRKSCGMLKENRFACFVVGDIRDKTGLYRNFIGETVNAFRAAGLSLYNEIILVNVVGSAPVRVGKPFGQYRKVGKVHQNVLVFYKGKNPKDIKRDFPADVVEGVDP